MTNIIRPKKTNDANVLDMRVSDKLGSELRDEINDSVARTQLFIQQELPNKLLITRDQFNSLVGYTQEMYQTTDRIFVTPDGVMEVEVKE